MAKKVTKKKVVNVDKADKVYSALMEIYRKNKLSVQDILVTLGNLTYALGASIGGYKGKGPGREELEIEYATKPNLPTALMLTGFKEMDWVNDLDKKYEEIVEELKEKKDE